MSKKPKVTDEELNKMSDEELFELLDKRSRELRKSTIPLTAHKAKRYAAISTLMNGNELSDEIIDKAQDIGKDNERELFKKMDEDSVKSIEKVSNPTIDNFYKNYISRTVSEEDGFLEFLKKTYRCPFEDNWNIVYKQCFDYWMKSGCDMWNSDTLYKIMCIVTKDLTKF